MLKVIKRVLRLSGDLSKRIYASFVFSFIDSIVAMFPVGAVFYTLTKIQNNKAFTGNDWLVIFGILLISLVVRMVFKYLVYSFQSTAGFGIEKAYEKSMEASYALERDFAPMNVAYSMVFRVAACAIILVSQIFALGGELDFSSLAVILIASFSIFNSVEVMGQMTAMIRSMEASLDRVERIKGEKNIDDGGGDISLKSYDIVFDHVTIA